MIFEDSFDSFFENPRNSVFIDLAIYISILLSRCQPILVTGTEKKTCLQLMHDGFRFPDEIMDPISYGSFFFIFLMRHFENPPRILDQPLFNSKKSRFRITVKHFAFIQVDVKKKKINGLWIYSLFFDSNRNGEFFKVLKRRDIPAGRLPEIDQYQEVLECRRNLESWLKSYGSASFFKALANIRTYGLDQ